MKVETNKKITLSTILSTNFAEILRKLIKKNCCANNFFLLISAKFVLKIVLKVIFLLVSTFILIKTEKKYYNERKDIVNSYKLDRPEGISVGSFVDNMELIMDCVTTMKKEM
jgi:hypothetical protein